LDTPRVLSEAATQDAGTIASSKLTQNQKTTAPQQTKLSKHSQNASQHAQTTKLLTQTPQHSLNASINAN